MVPAHSHLMQKSHGLCGTDLILFMLQKKPPFWKIQSFAILHTANEVAAPSTAAAKNTELLSVPRRHKWLLLYGDYAKLQFSFFCNVHEASARALYRYTAKRNVSFRQKAPYGEVSGYLWLKA